MIVYYILFAICLLERLNAVYLYDYVDSESQQTPKPVADLLEFEPVIPTINKDAEKIVFLKNINCDDFSAYAQNCTVEAAMMYNSSKKSPPLPSKITQWCKAIRHLTNCAIDWNADCKDVTESHFNQESIRGHKHVLTHVCDDEWFLSQYEAVSYCIDNDSDSWEECYSRFKAVVDEQKNKTHEWTHFETHFTLCCAKKQFRRCTLDALFDKPSICSYEQAAILQKFSVIVSEGDVFQDCEQNMMFSNCSGGDPRPSSRALARLMNAEAFNRANAIENSYIICLVLVLFCCL